MDRHFPWKYRIIISLYEESSLNKYLMNYVQNALQSCEIISFCWISWKRWCLKVVVSPGSHNIGQKGLKIWRPPFCVRCLSSKTHRRKTPCVSACVRCIQLTKEKHTKGIPPILACHLSQKHILTPFSTPYLSFSSAVCHHPHIFTQCSPYTNAFKSHLYILLKKM